MADYDIFREQLAIKYPSYGHALWRPSPKNPDRPVQIGDVGFIRRGKFHRLFNALLPADDPSHELGVPEYHEPLVPSLLDHFDTDCRDRTNYCSAGVSVKPDTGYNDGPDDFRQVSFQSDRTRGAAVLSLPVTAWREDTLARGDFGRWIVKHIDSCFAFARKLGLGIKEIEEIILVTGCDRTRSWTNVAFLRNPTDARVSFGVKVEGPDTSVNFQFSPEKAQGAVLRRGPEGTNLPENQCVFIRGFRVARPFRILPRRLKVALGPSPDPGGYDYDSGTDVVSIPAATKFRDPLHLLLDYIAEQASDCKMVLAHDDDLATIDGLGHDTSLETLEPDVMVDLLRKSNIEIHKVLSVLSPTDSGPNTDVSLVKVAMVSVTSQNWNNEPQPLAGQNIDLGYASESRGSSPAGVEGNLSVPTIRGDINKREASLLAHDDESAPSTPQDLADGTLRGIGHATEGILLAIGEIRDSHLNVWPSLNKFAFVGRHRPSIAVIATCCVVSLFRFVFSFTWAVIFKLVVTLLSASFLLSVWFKREFRYRRRLDDICERMEVLQRHVTSLQLDSAVPAVVPKGLAGSKSRTWGRNGVADVRNGFPITAGATPANLGMLGKSGMQAIPEGSTGDGSEVSKVGLDNSDALRRRRRPGPDIASPPSTFSPHPIEFIPRPRSAPPTNPNLTFGSHPRFSAHLPGYLPFLQNADTSFLGSQAPYLSGTPPPPPTHQSLEEPKAF